MLITANKLQQLITAQRSASHSEHNAAHDTALRIFDCRYALPQPGSQEQAQSPTSYGKLAYDKGHIPLAQFVDIDSQLSSKPTATSGRHPLPSKTDFNAQLQAWGLTPDSQVVIYDDAGGMFAARLWWMLHRWANIKQVALLDGGFPAWQRLGLASTQALPTVTPSNHVFNFNDHQHVSMQAIRQRVAANEKRAIVDARSHARYLGETNGIDSAFGHIPGAVSLPCQQNIDAEGYFLPIPQLKARFRALVALNQPEPLIHSCGSGVTACHNAFAMQLAGFNQYQVYIGSWSQWTQFTENPIETEEVMSLKTT